MFVSSEKPQKWRKKSFQEEKGVLPVDALVNGIF